MRTPETPRRFSASAARLERRVERTLAQCRRFEEMTGPLEPWATHWSTSTLARWLHIDHVEIESREKALVALALKATDEAGAAIDEYDPTDAGADHALFYQVARIEWEQRHSARRRRKAA